MPQSLSQLYVHLGFGARDREAMRRRIISPLQGFEMEDATLTQAVGLGCDRSPLWDFIQTPIPALCLHVAENGNAAKKGDENVETRGVGQALISVYLITCLFRFLFDSASSRAISCQWPSVLASLSVGRMAA